VGRDNTVASPPRTVVLRGGTGVASKASLLAGNLRFEGGRERADAPVEDAEVAALLEDFLPAEGVDPHPANSRPLPRGVARGHVFTTDVDDYVDQGDDAANLARERAHRKAEARLAARRRT
jgi:hypothetical protein